MENDSDYQTGAEVSASIQAVVGSAPEALDTLKELADALGNDADFAATITKKITAVSTDLSTEVTRAKAAESTNASAISTETSRAKAAENTLTTNLASEVTRAKAAEKTNADNIAKNTASIATNASGISTNASAIAALQTSLNDFVAITDSEIDAICK